MIQGALRRVCWLMVLHKLSNFSSVLQNLQMIHKPKACQEKKPRMARLGLYLIPWWVLPSANTFDWVLEALSRPSM